MSLTVLAFTVPAALFLVLALLPPGRTRLVASLGVAVVLLCLWLGHWLDLHGLGARGAHRAQVFVFFELLGLTLAWFMATSLQVLRRRFPAHWPRYSWPAVVAVTLVVTLWGVYRMATL